MGIKCGTESLCISDGMLLLEVLDMRGATLWLPCEGRGVGDEKDCTPMDESEACRGLDVAFGVNGDASGSKMN
jgi:hypothetical protein